MGGWWSSDGQISQEKIFEMKFHAKQLARESKKFEKAEAKEREKLKKAIEQGDAERVRIYAANAIRQKNQALNCLRLSSRVDGVASRLESAAKMQAISKQMQGVVATMENALGAMDIEKIALTMDQFEKGFDNVEVQAAVVEDAMAGATASATPSNEVDSLIKQFAEQNALDVGFMMPDAPSITPEQQRVPAGTAALPAKAARAGI